MAARRTASALLCRVPKAVACRLADLYAHQLGRTGLRIRAYSALGTSAAFLATEVVSLCVTDRTAQGMRVRLGLYPHPVSPRPAALGTDRTDATAAV